MEQRLFKSKKRYLISFVVATIIFLLIFAFSYALSYLEFQRVSSLQENVAYEIFEDKLDFSLFDKNVCSDASLQEVSEDLGFQGMIINDLEEKFGKNNKAVLFKKKFYSLVELEHLEFVKILNEKCNMDIEIILFFYSNERAELERSEEVGKLLTLVANKRENLIIYSFDINLDSDLIRKLLDKYGIEVSPTVLVNLEEKVVDPKTPEDVEKYLN